MGILILILLLALVLTIVSLASMDTLGRAIFFVIGLVVGYRGSMVGYDIALACVLVEIGAFAIRTIRERREARLGAVVGAGKPVGFWSRRR